MRKKIRLTRAVAGLTGRIETIDVLIPRSDRRSPVDAEEYHDRPCRRPPINAVNKLFKDPGDNNNTISMPTTSNVCQTEKLKSSMVMVDLRN